MPMPTLSVYQQQTLQKERKTRRTHSKVKTGCITCKQRRKKCDESRPFCLRCSSLGRKCDGYQQPLPDLVVAPKPPPSFSSCIVKIDNRRRWPEECHPRDHSVVSNPRPVQRTPILRAPSTITFVSEGDYHSFDYFRFKTGPRFECYFESNMWRTPILKAALSHPVVLKVATAVGAVNQRFNYGISREAFDLCATVDRLYRDAVRNFVSFLQDEQLSPHFHEVSMMASMLFSLFQAFQANYEESVQHMAFAMKAFWNRPFTITQSESRYLPCQMNPSRLIKLLRQLYLRVGHVIGSLPNICHYKAGTPLPPAATSFATQEHARDSIFTELEWILHLPVRFQYDPKRRREAQNLHVKRIFQWSVAIAGLVQSQGDRTIRQKEACRLLKAVRDNTFFMLYAILFLEPGTLSSPSFYTLPAINTTNANLNMNVAGDPSASSSEVWPNENDPNLKVILAALSALIESTPDLLTRYIRLSLLGDAVTDPNSPWYYTWHDYAADSGIGPPRTSHLLYESSAKTRHMVRCLLPGKCMDAIVDEDLTHEANDIYPFLERVSSFEEHAVLAAAKEGLIPNGPPLEWIDIRFFQDDRKILLRYCRPDGLEERSRGLIWTQQWLEF